MVLLEDSPQAEAAVAAPPRRSIQIGSKMVLLEDSPQAEAAVAAPPSPLDPDRIAIYSESTHPQSAILQPRDGLKR